jgi:NhaA family Na+:H+ antiporter
MRSAAPGPTRIFAAVAAPLQAFFRLEAASGLVLLGCAVAALVWANLAPDRYHAVFAAPLTLGVAGRTATFSVHALVNDGLMTVFFAVVGMEIKRELVHGELRTARQATLPLVAAAGGMVVPALIYAAFNAGHPGAPGWGIPMATDIAFCIGVLTLLRRRVPRALVVFVTALAIFDDIGGILVIALFYGTGIDVPWLVAAAAVAAGAVALGRARVGSGAAWLAATAALWWALHGAGIHATLAGVVIGLAVPASPRRPLRDVFGELAAQASDLARAAADEERDEAAANAIEERLEELEAPLTRFVHALHPWVAFGVMPAFALANSGVTLAALEPSQLLGRVAVGTAVALFAGKQLGVFAFTAAAVRLGFAPMPGGASFGKLLGVALVSGIGFTVALFIAGLAFPGDARLLDEAKLGILVGSLVSGLAGAAVLRATRARGAEDGAPRRAADA